MPLLEFEQAKEHVIPLRGHARQIKRFEFRVNPIHQFLNDLGVIEMSPRSRHQLSIGGPRCSRACLMPASPPERCRLRNGPRSAQRRPGPFAMAVSISATETYPLGCQDPLYHRLPLHRRLRHRSQQMESRECGCEPALGGQARKTNRRRISSPNHMM